MKRIVCALAFVMGAAVAVTAQTVTIVPNLKVGDTRTFDYKMTNTTGISFQGMTMESKVSNVFNATLTVTEVLEDGYKLACKYNSVACELKSPQGVKKMSSTEPNPEGSSLALKGMTGRVFEAVLRQDGKIDAHIDNADLIAGMKEAMAAAGYKPRKQDRYVAEILPMYADSTILKTVASALFIHSPGRELKAGQVWSEAEDVEGNMPMHVDSSYRLLEIKDKELLLSGKSLCSMTGGPKDLQGMTLVRLNGTGTADCVMDRDKCWAKSVKTSLDLDCYCSAANQEFPVKMQVITEIKEVENL